jgi:hypothetical protein
MSRALNGSREKRRLIWVVGKFNELLNSKEPAFINKLINNKVKPENIDRFEVAGGCNQKCDIKMVFNDGSEPKGIEHKGITGKCKTDEERPWSTTPQLLNAPYNFTSISEQYCKLWWESYIPLLKENYPSLPERPSYEEFIHGDASMGDPKTDFGKFLKQIKKSDKNEEDFISTLTDTSIRYLFEYLIDENMLEKLRTDCEKKMNDAIGEKHFWLNAYYPTTDSIVPENWHMSVTPKISNLKVVIEWNGKAPKFILKYNLSSNPDRTFEGKALLRWRNHKGIANISWNIS